MSNDQRYTGKELFSVNFRNYILTLELQVDQLVQIHDVAVSNQKKFDFAARPIVHVFLAPWVFLFLLVCFMVLNIKRMCLHCVAYYI